MLLPLCSGKRVVAMNQDVQVGDSLANSLEQMLAEDSLGAEEDTLALDNIPTLTDSLEIPADTVKKSKSGLDAVVNYKATDSLVFSAGNMAWLYGDAEVTYTDITLDAAKIQMSLDSSLVHALGMEDTITGKLKGKPVFKDNSGEYETRTMSYNFKTGKGFITDVTTQQGDGYVTGGTTKKMPDNDIFLEGGRYTTCDQTECPHFYLELTKARVRPNKNIVTGPAYLVVADVPLPVAVPFGFFPFTKKYSSGILMPSYGADQTKGLYLRDGGYYFALNDFMDLTLKGELYTKGSWGVQMDTHYSIRYKFKGSFSFTYNVTKTGDKGLADYSESNNMRITWSHSQDNRFNPNLSLSASVNFTTSGFERSNTTSVYSSDLNTSSKQSTVNATYRIPNSNWSLSASASIAQRTQDSTLDIAFPNLTASMTTWYPFKRKVKAGSDRWYEKIQMTYNMTMNNSVRTKEDKLFEKNMLRDWTNGIKHSLPVSATFNVLNYINVSPRISFTDRMYSHKTVQYYDPSLPNKNGTYGGVAKDTLYGFYNAYDFQTSISANTKLYGMYKPLWKSKLFAVRHVLTPSISFNYTPDFSDRKWGSWGHFYQPDSTAVGGMKEVRYSYFQGYSQGTTSQGQSGSISLSLANNIEAKVRSDEDSTGYKKISIIDNLQTSLSYNMIADSMRWSQTLPISATFKWGKNTTMNLSAQFDMYKYDEKGRHYDALRPIPRLMSTGYSWNYTINNEKLAKLFGYGSSDDDDEDDDKGYDLDSDDGYVEEDLDPLSIEGMQREAEKRAHRKKNKGEGSSKYDADGYLIWKIPWSLNFSYSMRVANKMDKFDPVTREYPLGIFHNLSVSGSIQPTQGWNFSFNSSFNVEIMQFTDLNINCSRDMHCWALTASLRPLGRYASFNVNVAVKSQMLSDLKYEKSSVSRSNKIDWYDD